MAQPMSSIPAYSSAHAMAATAGRVEAWRCLEGMHREGLCKAIGVSNFLPHHLDQLCGEAQIMPHVNQCEFNPMQQSPDTVDCCRK